MAFTIRIFLYWLIVRILHLEMLGTKVRRVTSLRKQKRERVHITSSHLSLFYYLAWDKQVFFGLQCTGRGLAVILAFWSILWTCVYLFYQVDETAGLFLVPTGLWVTVAAALNWSIYFQNK